MKSVDQKLGVVALAALVVSAMIGGGIFSLPQNMAQNASVTAVIVAWTITGIGIYFLANTFRILADARPDATAGIYAYARLGFGRFAGFQMAWAYWLCNIFGNVGYAVLLMDALDYFFPGVFTGGNNLWSILGGSVVIWAMNFAVMRGTRQASAINTVGTIFKLLPLVIFLLAMIAVFKWRVFGFDMTGRIADAARGVEPRGGMLGQIKSTMLVTLWAFLGIEGAVVVSARARDQRSVGRATLAGFLICLALYFFLSVLPFGRMTQGELAALPNPSTAEILQTVICHKWGGVLMNLGVVIALLTSWLAFTIMIAQIPYAAALDGTFPRIFRHENRRGAPDISLIVSSVIMQITLILTHFSGNAWNTMLSVTSVMVLPPYMACTLYLWKIGKREDFPKIAASGRRYALFCGIAGSCYAVWMIYAAGIKYLLTACCLLALGIPVFFWARHNAKADHPQADDPAYLRPAEIWGAVAIVAIALIAVYCQLTGKIQL